MRAKPRVLSPHIVDAKADPTVTLFSRLHRSAYTAATHLMKANDAQPYFWAPIEDPQSREVWYRLWPPSRGLANPVGNAALKLVLLERPVLEDDHKQLPSVVRAATKVTVNVRLTNDPNFRDHSFAIEPNGGWFKTISPSAPSSLTEQLAYTTLYATLLAEAARSQSFELARRDRIPYAEIGKIAAANPRDWEQTRRKMAAEYFVMPPQLVSAVDAALLERGA